MRARRFLLVGALVALVAPALLAGPAAATPAATGPVEAVVGERTPTSRLVDNRDGTFTLYQELAAATTQAAAAGWTSVYSAFPDARYWQRGTSSDGRAGAGFSGWTRPVGVVRSYFQFDVAALRGKQVLRADLNLFGSHSATCGVSGVSLQLTGPVDHTTTWRNQPGMVSVQSRPEPGFCNGGRWTGFDVTREVTTAVYGLPAATFAVTAQDEWDQFGWRWYGTVNTGQPPTLVVTFEGAPGR